MAFNIFKTALKGFEKLKDGVEDIASPFSVLKTKKNPTIANNIISTIATIQKAKKAAPVVLSNAQKLSNDIRTVKPFLKKGVDKLQSPNAQMFETVINALTPISSNFTGRTGIQTPTKGERFISRVADVTAPATRMNQNILRGISKAPTITKDFIVDSASPRSIIGIASGKYNQANKIEREYFNKLANNEEIPEELKNQYADVQYQLTAGLIDPSHGIKNVAAKASKNLLNKFVKVKNPEEVKNIAAKTGIGMTDDMAVQIAKTSSESKIRGILDQGRDVIKLISDELKTNGKNVDLTQANKSLPETLPIFKKEAGGSQKNTGSYQNGKESKSSQTEDLMRGMKNNIRIDKLGLPTKQAEQEIKDVITRGNNFAKQRRGVQTWDMTREAAEIELPKMLKKMKGGGLKKGVALNDSQLTALAEIQGGYQTAIDDISKKIASGDNRTENLLEQEKLRLEQYLSLQSLSGATAEAGRALQSIRMIKKAMSPEILRDEKIMKQVFDKLGGREKMEKVAKRLVELGDDELAKFKFVKSLSEKHGSEKLADFVDWYFFSSLLSGPKTQGRNFTGNIINYGYQNLIVDPVAGAADTVLSKFRKDKTRQIRTGEIRQKYKGALSGAAEGWDKARFMMKNGFIMDDFVNAEFGKATEIGSKIFGGKAALPLNIVSRGMQAVDQFFGSMAASTELHGLAYTYAKNKGLKGDAYKKAVIDFIENPTPEVIEKMRDAGRRITFQQENPLSNAVGYFTENKRFQRNGKTDIVIWNPLKTQVPFVKTPTNILQENAKNSPVGSIYWFANEFLRNDEGIKRLASRDAAKTLIGTAGVFYLYQLAKAGFITGTGPKDPEMRKAKEATGWRGKSIVLPNGTSINYQSLPLAGVLMGVAAMAEPELYDGEDPSISNNALNLLNSITEQSFLQGVDNISKSMQYGDFSRITNGMASSAVPFSALLRTIAIGQDDTARKANSTFDAMKQNIPSIPFLEKYSRQSLQPQLDIFGREIKYPGGAARRMFDFLNVTQKENDHESILINEALRLGVTIQYPENKQKLTNIKTNEQIKLNPDEKFEYSKQLGEMMRTTLDRSLFSPEYQNMSDDEKRVYLEERIADGKKFVDGVYFIESLTTEEKKQLGNKVVDYSIAVPTETKDLEAYDTLTGNKIDLSTEDKSVYYERIWRGIYDAINQGEQQKEFPLLDQQRKSDFINSQVGSVKSFMKDGFSILLSEGEEKFNHTLGIKLQSDSDEFLKNSLLDIGVEKILDFAKNDLPVDEFMQSSEMKMILEKVQTDEDMDRILKGVKNSLLAEGKSAYENFLSNQNTETKALYLYGDLLELSGDNKAIDKFIEKIPTYAQSGILDDATIEKVIELYTTKTLQEQEDVNNVVDEADNKPIWPTTSKTVTQQYGYGHTGLDIGGNLGDPVNAMLPGVVVSAQWGGPYGNFVVVDHGNGLVTRYAHLQKYGVQRGDQVKAGDFLGEQGSTGNSTGPHLHFEVLKDNKFVNPYEYVNF